MEPNVMTTDTICAISTPPGTGGIATARVSGPRALEIVDSIWHGQPLARATSHTAHLGNIDDTRGELLDQAVATVYRSPRSYTGDDVVEISVHGSRWIQRELIATLCAAGCRLAEPGEFTRRAFIAGHLDLAEAEAVADMIASDSRAAHRAAATQMRGHYSQRLATLRDRLIELASLLELELDFSEEDVEFASRRQLLDIATELHTSLIRLRDSFATGSAIKEGIPVAIIGPTNAGKSSLLNTITGEDRAIVSDIHGTTRDIVDTLIEIGDYRFRFQDTAGLRDTTDTIERIGIERSLQAARKARIIICIVDGTTPTPTAGELSQATDSNPDAAVIAVVNKIDLMTPEAIGEAKARITRMLPKATVMALSAKDPESVDTLRQQLTDIIDRSHETDDLIVTNARHAQALDLAATSIARAITALRQGISHTAPPAASSSSPTISSGDRTAEAGYPPVMISGDLIAQDIRETIHHLGTITGAITTDTLLATIFTRFCIGK